MKKKHKATNDKFDAIFSKAVRREWAKMITEWELDKTKPNPYTHAEKGNIFNPLTRVLHH